MVCQRLLLCSILLLGALPVQACVDPPPRSPTVFVDVQGTNALLVFLGYTTQAIGPGDFCALALNIVPPITGVAGVVAFEPVSQTVFPQLSFTPNVNVGMSFGAVQPAPWAGFFSNVAGVVSAGTDLYWVFNVTVTPGTTYASLEAALRGETVMIATDEATVTGMVTGTAQAILPAGCIVDFSSPSISHNVDNQTITPNNSAACALMAGPHAANRYFRSYRPADFGFSGSVTIIGVDFGIQIANAGGAATTQPAELRLYRDPTPPNPAPIAQLIPLTSEPIQIADSGAAIVNVQFSASQLVMATDTLVIELFTPDGIMAGHNFRIGSNDLGQTSPSYIAAMACGINDATDIAGVCCPNMHMILDLELLGSPFPPDPGCMLTAPASPAGGDVALTLDSTTAACTEVDYDFFFSTDGGTTFAPATAAPSSPLANPSGAVPAGPATFVWDSSADMVGTVVSQVTQVAAQVVDDLHRATPQFCFDIVTVDNTALCQLSCGDCDLNLAGPDVLDALEAAQIATGLIVPIMAQTGCCDVDSDSDVDVLDALGMAQAAVSLPVALTCP